MTTILLMDEIESELRRIMPDAGAHTIAAVLDIFIQQERSWRATLTIERETHLNTMRLKDRFRDQARDALQLAERAMAAAKRENADAAHQGQAG